MTARLGYKNQSLSYLKTVTNIMEKNIPSVTATVTKKDKLPQNNRKSIDTKWKNKTKQH